MVLYGATTGRDGIGGVSVLASATLDDSSEDVAADRADRRPVRREAADRSLARADRAGPARGAAGPGRRRHHLRRERVGGARGHGRTRSTSTPCRCASRAWRRSRSSRANRRSACSRSCTPRSSRTCARCASDGGCRTAVIAELVEGGTLTVTHGGRGRRRGAGPLARPTTVPNTTGRSEAPATRPTPPTIRPSRRSRATCSRRSSTVLASPNVASEARGSGSSTTRSCRARPSPGRAATPPSCACPAR